MKKRISIIALMLAMVMVLTSCAYVNQLVDLITGLISPSVALTDKALESEKIIDFKDGPNTDVLFGSDGWSNGDVFNVVWRDRNVHYENGIMRLGITEEADSAWLNDQQVDFNYTAGEARTQNYYHYGDYEVSMKPSANPGTASTFFVCTGPYDLKDGNPNPHDEIDIEFLGQDTTHVQFNFFVDGKGGNEYMYDLGFDASLEFHRYGFRWEENAITWFVDGVPVYKVTTDTTVQTAGNVRIVEKLPSTAGRILTNYWCGNERAWGWMGIYNGETKDNGTQYQWIATSAEGAPLNPPVVNPPAGGGEETTEINWAEIDAIVPEFPSAEKYVVTTEGTTANITYTDVAGNEYKPVELDVTDAVAGKNYVHLTITNNGTETVNVRVNMFDPTLTGNNQATNISATMNGESVRTDYDWGGSFFDIPAGETAELVVNFGVGGVKLQLMIDSSRNDSVLRSGDITVSELKFAAVGEVEAPHKCEDADENGKCDGCGEDMPAPPAPAPENPVSGDLTTVINGEEFTIGGNVTDGYGVNVDDTNNTIKVEYTNIVGNSYKNIWATVSSIAGTRTTLSLKVTNNGTADAKFRIDMESQTQTSANTTCCNVSATMNGEYVWTDTNYGGTTFVIPAGQTVEIELVYDASKLPTNLKFFFDSCQWDDATSHAGEVVLSEIEFKGEYTPADPTPDPEPTPDPTPDTGLQLNFYPEANTGYEVNGLNIKYTGAGNTYKPVTAPEIGSHTLGKNTLTVTITNNGAADARVRVDLQGTTWISTGDGSGTDACNISSVGGDSWTDTTWGGTAVTVPAGQSVTITITYSNYGSQGLVKNILVFVDSARGDATTYTSDITLSGITFGGEETAPVDPDPTPDPTPVLPEVPTDGGYVKFEGNLDKYTVITESEYANVIQVTYSDVSDNTYVNLNTWIKDKADGNNTFSIAIRNNGTATVYITVKLETADNVQVIEKKMVIGAGELATLTTEYTGEAALLYLFVDSGYSETTASHAGDITIAGIKFSVTEEEPAPAPSIPEGEYLSYTGNDVYTLSATPDQYVNTLNVTYTAAETDTYLNVNTWIQDKAAGKSTLSVYLTNNGTEAVKILVKLETDGTSHGETTVEIAAGETLHVELAYTEGTNMLFFFIATGWNENAHTQSAGNVTIAGVEFK